MINPKYNKLPLINDKLDDILFFLGKLPGNDIEYIKDAIWRTVSDDNIRRNIKYTLYDIPKI